jgi:hypothetical protein
MAQGRARFKGGGDQWGGALVLGAGCSMFKAAAIGGGCSGEGRGCSCRHASDFNHIRAATRPIRACGCGKHSPSTAAPMASDWASRIEGGARRWSRNRARRRGGRSRSRGRGGVKAAHGVVYMHNICTWHMASQKKGRCKQ